MGAFLDLLKSEHFRTKTGMYVGTTRFRDVSLWLSGYEYALRDQGGPDELRGFYEWLLLQFNDAPRNVGWQGILAFAFGETEGTQAMFQCLDKFLEEKERVGLEEMVKRHAEYQKRRNATHSKIWEDHHYQTWLPLCQKIAQATLEKTGRTLTVTERKEIWCSRVDIVEKLLAKIQAAPSAAEVDALLTNIPRLERPDPTGWVDAP